eukprot:4730304-Pyramimonas_sp.AAC.1
MEVLSVVRNVMQAGQSILAVCSQPLPLIKCDVCDILEAARCRVPRAPIAAHADDLTQCVQGAVEEVTQKLAPAARDLCGMLQKRGCKISSKSCVVASSLKGGRPIQAMRDKLGAPLKAVGA